MGCPNLLAQKLHCLPEEKYLPIPLLIAPGCSYIFTVLWGFSQIKLFFPLFFLIFFFFKLLVWKCFGKVSASCTAATLLCTGHWWPEASKSCREQQNVMITPVCSFGTHADQGLLWEFSPGTRISALLPAAQQCFCFAYPCRCCFGMAVPKHLAAGVGTWSQVCSCRQGTPASPPSPHEGAPDSISYAFLPSRVSLVWLIFNPSTCWDNSTWGNQENLVPSC